MIEATFNMAWFAQHENCFGQKDHRIVGDSDCLVLSIVTLK